MENNRVLYRIRKKMGKIKRKIYKTNHAYWYCRILAEDDSNSLKKRPDLRLEFYNFHETLKWIKANQKKFPWIFNQKQVNSAHKYRHYYPNLKLNGRIVGFLKIGVDHVYIEDYEGEIYLEDDEAFIYDTFILPEFRRKNLGSFMLQQSLNELKKIGFLYVFCHIPAWNIASIKLYHKLGFKPVAHVRYLRLLKSKFFSSNPDRVREKGRDLVASIF